MIYAFAALSVICAALVQVTVGKHVPTAANVLFALAGTEAALTVLVFLTGYVFADRLRLVFGFACGGLLLGIIAYLMVRQATGRLGEE